jgi:hypothetical protein
MSHTYTAKYAHNNSDVPGRIELAATTEAAAIAEADAFVEQGYDGTWINVSLEGGAYAAVNRNGRAVGEITRYA